MTESHLDSTISDSNICPDGYACCRIDRSHNGGGCALFVASKWPSCKRRTDLESDSLEMVYVEICPYQAKNTICAVMYKSLSMDPDEFISGLEREFLERVSDEVERTCSLWATSTRMLFLRSHVNTLGNYCKQHDYMVLLK